MKTPTTLHLDETSARQVLMLRAFETEESPQWTAADREWATRVARASLDESATPAQFVAERARQAMQRLAPRETGVRAALAARFSGSAWLLTAVVAGLMLGLVIDHIGPAQRINLLAPPIWALVAWNLLVYLALLLAPLRPAGSGGRIRRWLGARWQPKGGRWGRHAALARFATDWVKVAAPLDGARAALVLHLAAAALALGVVGGMYVRGLVLDYRAGWESTFLGADSVHTALSILLAPASALTGIAVPDAATLATQQVGPARPAQAPAAPWLHLYAATLGLFVIGPRLLLAAVARLQVWRLRRRLPLPAQDPWFQQGLRAPGGLTGTVWLLPHAAPASAGVALALQQALEAINPGRLRLQVADPVPYGDEDQTLAATPPPDAAAVLVLAELATTPETEVHGRLLDRLAVAAGRMPRLLLVDETGFRQRLGDSGPRLEARREAWRQFADAHHAALLMADLGSATTAWQDALATRLSSQ